MDTLEKANPRRVKISVRKTLPSLTNGNDSKSILKGHIWQAIYS